MAKELRGTLVRSSRGVSVHTHVGIGELKTLEASKFAFGCQPETELHRRDSRGSSNDFDSRRTARSEGASRRVVSVNQSREAPWPAARMSIASAQGASRRLTGSRRTPRRSTLRALDSCQANSNTWPWSNGCCPTIRPGHLLVFTIVENQFALRPPHRREASLERPMGVALAAFHSPATH